jgi:hypothetical protein
MFSEVAKRDMNPIAGCSCSASTAELCCAAIKKKIDGEGNLERSNGAKTT